MLTILMTALTGLAYPLAMTGLAGRLFPYQANGSLIERDGKVIGSELIGQNFTGEGYFHGRPSATTDTDPNDSTKTVPAPYNASNSGRLELGSDVEGADRPGEGGCAALAAATKPSTPVPVDLVTTSASGLDPTSRPPPPCSRFRASPRRASSPKPSCATSSGIIPRAAARHSGRTACQRAEAQPRARQAYQTS